MKKLHSHTYSPRFQRPIVSRGSFAEGVSRLLNQEGAQEPGYSPEPTRSPHSEPFRGWHGYTFPHKSNPTSAYPRRTNPRGATPPSGHDSSLEAFSSHQRHARVAATACRPTAPSNYANQEFLSYYLGLPSGGPPVTNTTQKGKTNLFHNGLTLLPWVVRMATTLKVPHPVSPRVHTYTNRKQ